MQRRLFKYQTIWFIILPKCVNINFTLRLIYIFKVIVCIIESVSCRDGLNFFRVFRSLFFFYRDVTQYEVAVDNV